MTWSRKHRIALLLTLVIIGDFLLISLWLREPFIGGHRSYSTLYSMIARNYARYGYLTTGLGWVINADTVSPSQFIYYRRHPPLFGLILSLQTRIWGDTECATRLMPISFSLGNLLLIFLIARNLKNRTIGLTACLLAALTPINVCYASHVDHVGAAVLFFMLAAFYAYLLWFETGRIRYFLCLCGLFLLGAFTAWPAYFLAPALMLHHLRNAKQSRRGQALLWLLPLLAILAFVAFLAHGRLLTGTWLGGQIPQMLRYRLGLSPTHPQWTEIGYLLPAEPGIHFVLGKFLLYLLRTLAVLFSPVLLLFSLIWAGDLVARSVQRKVNTRGCLLAIFFLGFGAYCFVFPNVTRQHEHVLLCLWPPLAISAAVGLSVIRRLLSGRRALWLLLCATIFLMLAAQTVIVARNRHQDWTTNTYWEYSLGNAIRKKVPAGNEVLTSSPISFAARYYADRFIQFDISQLADFLRLKDDPARNYRYFVVRDEKDCEISLLNHLRTNYPSHAEDGFVFFRLHP